MSKSWLKASLLGGLVVFVWGMLSWMVFPLHKRCFHQFTDETKVAAVISECAPKQGAYLLPYTFDYNENSSPEQMRQAVDMMQNGPFMFASVVPNGVGTQMARPLIVALVIQVLGAGIITWMLSKTRGLKFRQKVGFVTLFGLGVGILGLLPSWNWLGFTSGYVAVNLIDLIVSWWLAGLVIAKTLKGSK